MKAARAVLGIVVETLNYMVATLVVVSLVIVAVLGALLLVALVGLFFAAPFAGIALGILLPLHWFGVI